MLRSKCGYWFFLCAFSLGHLLAAADSTVVVVLDDSGSMKANMTSPTGRESRMELAKKALSKVVQQLPEKSNLGILLLNGAKGNQGWLVALGPLDRASCLAKIKGVKADGGTPLGASMKKGMDELLKMRSKQVYGDFRLLVVTDGEANDRQLLDRYLPDLLSRGITIDAIGVDMGADHSLASRTHSYRRANDAASFEKAIADVFAESTSTDSSDRGGSDFDLIASLPDEFARDALHALAQVENEPVTVKVDRDIPPLGSEDSTSSVQVQGPTQVVNVSWSGFMGCCMGMMIVIVLLLAMIVLGARRRR